MVQHIITLWEKDYIEKFLRMVYLHRYGRNLALVFLTEKRSRCLGEQREEEDLLFMLIILCIFSFMLRICSIY